MPAGADAAAVPFALCDGEMRTPFLLMEIVTSWSSSGPTWSVGAVAAGCLADVPVGGTGATGATGAGRAGGIGTAGVTVTSSLVAPEPDSAMSLRTSDATSSRIDSRMNLVQVMPTSQLP